jgi:hypothetical protein
LFFFFAGDAFVFADYAFRSPLIRRHYAAIDTVFGFARPFSIAYAGFLSPLILLPLLILRCRFRLFHFRRRLPMPLDADYFFDAIPRCALCQAMPIFITIIDAITPPLTLAFAILFFTIIADYAVARRAHLSRRCPPRLPPLQRHCRFSPLIFSHFHY